MMYYEFRKMVITKAISEYCKKFNKNIIELEDIYDCWDDNQRMGIVFISCQTMELGKLSLFNIISLMIQEKKSDISDRRLLLDIYAERYLPTNKG